MLHEQFHEVFAGLTRAYGKYTIGDNSNIKVEGTAKTISEPYTSKLWELHLTGKLGLGVIPINDENKCRWGCIDVDEYNLNLEDLSKKFKKQNIIICRSKSGGAHLFIFTKKFINAKLMIKKLKYICDSLHFSKYDLFPRQDKILTERGDTGNWLNMPYFKGEETDRYAIYDGKALSPERFLKWIEKFSLDNIEDINLGGIDKPETSEDLLPSGPPCLQHLVKQGFPEGTRNNGLFNLGVYLRKAHPDDWEDKLEDMNLKYMNPPLKNREFSTVLYSLNKKEYNYKCNEQPIQAYCDRPKCLTCKFGVNDDGQMPSLNGITKISTDPPCYFLTISEKRIGPLKSEQIINFNFFKKVVFENLNMLLPKIAEKLWIETVNDLMIKLEQVEAPDDSSNKGRLWDLLERFCTGSTASEVQEDLLRGKAVVKKEITEFRINDFMEFLERHRFKEFKLHEVTAYLKNKGATHDSKKIKGKFTNFWQIPSFTKQQEAFTQPKIDKEAYE
jgi:hypothetical protein